MKANTSVTIDEHVLDRVRTVAKAAGETTSVFLERAARRELMYLAGLAVADYERRQDTTVEERALADHALHEVAAAEVNGRKAD